MSPPQEEVTLPITVESTRFGAIEVPDGGTIVFPNGLIGLPGTRYALVPHDEDSEFLWLQSLEEPALALPVTNPWVFFPDFQLELSDEDAGRLALGEGEHPDVYVTVRAAAELADFRANLRAPILVHAGVGHQVINEAPDAPVRAPLFALAGEAVEHQVA